MVHHCTNKKRNTRRHGLQEALGPALTCSSSLQPVSQINSPKPNYFQLPFCSHCDRDLFFAHAVSHIWSDSSHYMPCCVPANPILKNLVVVSFFIFLMLPLNTQTFPPEHTPPPLDLPVPLLLLYFAHRITSELCFPPVDIFYNRFMPVPQAICDREPTKFVPKQYNYQSYNNMLDIQGI